MRRRPGYENPNYMGYKNVGQRQMGYEAYGSQTPQEQSRQVSQMTTHYHGQSHPSQSHQTHRPNPRGRPRSTNRGTHNTNRKSAEFNPHAVGQDFPNILQMHIPSASITGRPIPLPIDQARLLPSSGYQMPPSAIQAMTRQQQAAMAQNYRAPSAYVAASSQYAQQFQQPSTSQVHQHSHQVQQAQGQMQYQNYAHPQQQQQNMHPGQTLNNAHQPLQRQQQYAHQIQSNEYDDNRMQHIQAPIQNQTTSQDAEEKPKKIIIPVYDKAKFTPRPMPANNKRHHRDPTVVKPSTNPSNSPSSTSTVQSAKQIDKTQEAIVDFSDLPAGFFDDMSMSSSTANANYVVPYQRSGQMEMAVVDQQQNNKSEKTGEHWTNDAPMPPIEGRGEKRQMLPYAARIEKMFHYNWKYPVHCPIYYYTKQQYMALNKLIDQKLTLLYLSFVLGYQEWELETFYMRDAKWTLRWRMAKMLHAVREAYALRDRGVYGWELAFQHQWMQKNIIKNMPNKNLMFSLYSEEYLRQIRQSRSRSPYVEIVQDVPSEKSRLQYMRPYMRRDAQRPKKVWAIVFYHEFVKRLGEIHMATGCTLNIDGSIREDGDNERLGVTYMHLGRIMNAFRTVRTHRVRKDIDDGIRLFWNGTSVFLKILRPYPIFFQCPLYALRRRDKENSVYRFQNETDKQPYLKVWDRRLFDYFKKLAFEQQSYQMIYALNNLCRIRISFLKGFGTVKKYPRKKIQECPAWVEIQIAEPMEEINRELRDMYKLEPDVLEDSDSDDVIEIAEEDCESEADSDDALNDASFNLPLPAHPMFCSMPY